MKKRNQSGVQARYYRVFATSYVGGNPKTRKIITCETKKEVMEDSRYFYGKYDTNKVKECALIDLDSLRWMANELGIELSEIQKGGRS